MQKKQSIRARCIEWAARTYKEELLLNSQIPDELKKDSLKLFETLNIADVPMNGNSCEGLPKTDEQRVGLKRTYSDIFHTESEKPYFSPATYLSEIAKECKASNISEQRTIGAMARGLRTFTSLLREPDFAEQIKEQLFTTDSNVEASLNAKQDSSDHTDVLLTFKKKEYRIWLYQFSSRGLPHDVERLSGKRGTLPNGTHVICPLKTELAMDLTKFSKSLAINEQKLSKYKTDLSECSEKAKSKKALLEERISKLEEKISELKKHTEELTNIVSNELDIIEGWFFYSPSHVSRIVKFITETQTPQDYKTVYDMLTAPEKFVGSINMFNKEKDYE